MNRKKKDGCTIIGMAFAGLGLSVVAGAIFFCVFSTNTEEISKSPPWYFFSAIATVPSILLTWYWRKKAKDSEIGTNRFIQAIQQLGHGNTAVRLGGVYALEQVAQNSTEDHGVIIETLSAFVRDNAPKDRGDNQDAEETEGLVGVATDIQAAVTVLGRLGGLEGKPIDLRKTRLVGVDMSGGDFKGAKLYDTDFYAADMENANLDGADLTKANLSMAVLKGAIFSKITIGLLGIRTLGLPTGEIISLGAELQNAVYDDNTVFPEGFEPEKRGMRKLP